MPDAKEGSLDQGWVVDASRQLPGSSAMVGRAVAVVDDIPEAVMHVLLDVGRYRFWVPNLKGSRVTRRKGWHTYAVLETDFPWPVKDAWAYLKLTRYDRKGRVFEARWAMKNGTFKTYHGWARIEPWNDDASKTLIRYSMTVELKSAAPDGFVKKGIRAVCRVFVERLRLRLKALRKYKKLPAALTRPPPLKKVSPTPQSPS